MDVEAKIDLSRCVQLSVIYIIGQLSQLTHISRSTNGVEAKSISHTHIVKEVLNDSIYVFSCWPHPIAMQFWLRLKLISFFIIE